MAAAAAASREKPLSQEPPILERPDSRVPALTESPKDPEPPTTTSSPIASPAPAPPRPVGDETTWPTEYANKPLADLMADWERLNEEFEKDLKAEFERRIQDGRCETNPYDMQSLLGKRKTSGSGFYCGRKVENTWKAVTFDPSVEPDLFIKRNKAGWLSREIGRRQQ